MNSLDLAVFSCRRPDAGFLIFWQVVLHRRGAEIPVDAAVEESGRDGPGAGEHQPAVDWLMGKVAGSTKASPAPNCVGSRG